MPIYTSITLNIHEPQYHSVMYILLSYYKVPCLEVQMYHLDISFIIIISKKIDYTIIVTFWHLQEGIWWHYPTKTEKKRWRTKLMFSSFLNLWLCPIETYQLWRKMQYIRKSIHTLNLSSRMEQYLPIFLHHHLKKKSFYLLTTLHIANIKNNEREKEK